MVLLCTAGWVSDMGAGDALYRGDGTNTFDPTYQPTDRGVWSLTVYERAYPGVFEKVAEECARLLGSE